MIVFSILFLIYLNRKNEVREILNVRYAKGIFNLLVLLFGAADLLRITDYYVAFNIYHALVLMLGPLVALYYRKRLSIAVHRVYYVQFLPAVLFLILSPLLNVKLWEQGSYMLMVYLLVYALFAIESLVAENTKEKKANFLAEMLVLLWYCVVALIFVLDFFKVADYHLLHWAYPIITGICVFTGRKQGVL